MRGLLSILIVIALFAFAISCSSEKTNVISVSYHNTTARYNAYFIARERIREVEKAVIKNQDHNYDQILNIYPPLDSSISVTYAVQIEECLKKASIAIQNHPNSKWVDDSYVLVGLARLYGYEYTHAIETFKYVNTNSKDKNTRHLALVHLMRTFIEYGEMNNALAVSDYLEDEDINKENEKNLNLTRAWYYQVREDYNNMVYYLDLASTLITRNDDRARINFIIGQVYQELGFESEAFSNYKKCLASNPEYELSFYAKLNMAQVTQLTESRDVRNVENYFKRLAKDAKNKEFKDKIYYEWGIFEMKQGDLDLAIARFNQSIRESISNPRQKGISYLILAEIYYDTLKNYALAKDYYDSTVQVLPRNYEDYDDIVSRQMILDDFVRQLETIEVQDSLLALAQMDSASLMILIDAVIEKQELEQIEKENNQKRRNDRSVSSPIGAFENSGITTGTSTWYFANPSAVAIGSSEFIKIWGSRVLEDHWRRSLKLSVEIANDTETRALDNTETIAVDKLDDSPGVKGMGSKRNDMYGSVPFTKESKEKSLKFIEEAYYKLGNIYYFNLKEPENSITAFETLIRRFPETGYKPEALYQLYLIYLDIESDKAEVVKNQLITEFPETTYARLIINPNFREESQAISEILKDEYKRAYRFFLDQDYEGAQYLIDETAKTYPNANFLPNLLLLKILIVGKTQDLYEYQLQLGEFIEDYPESDVIDYAKTLLAASDDYKNNLIKLKEAEYVLVPDDVYYFIIVFTFNQDDSDKISLEVASFNTANFPNEELKTGILQLDDTNSIIMVDHFNEEDRALLYHDLFKAQQKINTEYPSLKFDNFVISKTNFNILYQTKELDTYKKFYTSHY